MVGSMRVTSANLATLGFETDVLETRPQESPQTGSGGPHRAIVSAIGHCGEILQGAVMDGKHTHRFLVSLPVPVLCTVAEIEEADSDGLQISPGWKEKALLAARAACVALGTPKLSATLTLTSDIPVGRGCGSSTADCTAAVRAVARLLRRTPRPETIAKIVQAAEQACDSTMFDLAPVGFRHREGTVQEYLGGSWPAMFIVAVDLSSEDTQVGTLETARARYTNEQMARFQATLTGLRRAVHSGDASTVGEVSTWSADVNESYLPKTGWAELKRIGRAFGAYGVAAAHTGTVTAFLFPYLFSASPLLRDFRRCLSSIRARILSEYRLTGL
jgi:uncharacterized protein involved in propanediol utilization